MIHFKNKIDHIKFVINELIAPGDKVLVFNSSINFKMDLDFLMCDSYFVADTPGCYYDIFVNSHLPFENEVFDIVLNFGDTPELQRVVKKLNKTFNF